MLDLLKQLREKTCASIGDCKKAIEESGGDLEKAEEILRRKGAITAGKKSCRETNQGIIEAYIHANKKIGVLLELNCETDFVARNEMFKELAHDLAMHIAATNPRYLNANDIPQDIIENEKSVYREQLVNSGKPDQIIQQIIDGKIKKYHQEICLLKQPFVKDQDVTIEEFINGYISKIGENIKIGRFVRYEI